MTKDDFVEHLQEYLGFTMAEAKAMIDALIKVKGL
jgi:hypothetical protein